MSDWTPTFLPYVEGYDAGIGVVRATGEPRSKSIKGVADGVTLTPGGSGLTLITRIESTQDLENELGINVSASYGTALSPWKAKEKFEFSKKCQLHTYSLAIVIHSLQKLGFIQIDELELIDDAKMLASNNSDGFVEQYGDSFIRGIDRGGQLFVMIRLDTSTQQTHQTIKNTLDGSVGAFSAEAMVTLTESVKKTGAKTTILIYNEGGSAAPASLATPDQVASVLKPWLDSLMLNAAPYSVTLAPYTIVSGFDPPQAVELQHKQDVLKRCGEARYYALDGLNSIEYILKNVDDFTGVDTSVLGSARAGFAIDLDVIAQAAAYANGHAADALEPESFSRVKLGRPDYKLTVLPSPMPALRIGFVSYPPAFVSEVVLSAFDHTKALYFPTPPWEQGFRAPSSFWGPLIRSGPLPAGFSPDFWTDFWRSTFHLEGAQRITVIGWMPLPTPDTGKLNSAIVRVHGRLTLPEPAAYRLVASFVELSNTGVDGTNMMGGLGKLNAIWSTHGDLSANGEFDIALTLNSGIEHKAYQLNPVSPHFHAFPIPAYRSYFIELALLRENTSDGSPAGVDAAANQIEVYEVLVE